MTLRKLVEWLDPCFCTYSWGLGSNLEVLIFGLKFFWRIFIFFYVRNKERLLSFGPTAASLFLIVSFHPTVVTQVSPVAAAEHPTGANDAVNTQWQFNAIPSSLFTPVSLMTLCSPNLFGCRWCRCSRAGRLLSSMIELCNWNLKENQILDEFVNFRLNGLEFFCKLCKSNFKFDVDLSALHCMESMWIVALLLNFNYKNSISLSSPSRHFSELVLGQYFFSLKGYYVEFRCMINGKLRVFAISPQRMVFRCISAMSLGVGSIKGFLLLCCISDNGIWFRFWWMILTQDMSGLLSYRYCDNHYISNYAGQINCMFNYASQINLQVFDLVQLCKLNFKFNVSC